MSLSPEQQQKFNAAKPGNVVYIGPNNVGPLGPTRQNSGIYSTLSKVRTVRSPTDPQVGQFPNLSDRKNVTGPDYANANNLNRNNSNIPSPSSLRRGTMQRTAVRHHATTVTNEPSGFRRGTLSRTAVRGRKGGARKKTRKHKKQSRK